MRMRTWLCRLFLATLLTLQLLPGRAQPRPDARLNKLEYYIEQDILDSAQVLLYAIRAKIPPGQNISDLNYYLSTRQTELYYYAGLYQFGQQSASKALEIAYKLKDSFFVADAHHYTGLMLQELHQSDASALHFREAIAWMPRGPRPAGYRYLISLTHAYHSLSEELLKENRKDAALHYCRLALTDAWKGGQYRAEAMALYTFGQIHQQEAVDSALRYYEAGAAIAIDKKMRDVHLLCLGGIATAYGKRKEMHRADAALEEGFRLLSAGRPVNPNFSELFYEQAAGIYRASRNAKKLIRVLELTKKLQDQKNQATNSNIQKIIQEYAANENKLILLQLDKANHSRQLLIYSIVFPLVLLLVLLALGFTIYGLRKRAQLRLAYIRQEIGKDLHDDIGSGLSVIRMMSELMCTSTELPAVVNSYAQKIAETTKDTAQRMNAIVWSMNTENDTLDNFIEYSRQFGVHYFENSAIMFEASIDPAEIPPIPLNGLVRKHLFLILKEAWNNCLKHSGATMLHTSFVWVPGRLTITAKDNGRGMEPGRHTGNGLKNMHKRMEAIGGRIHIATSEGVCVTIELPL